ncbi:MAG TPA: phosphoglucosamine mutase [Candidatus Dormibacteraeota bacterium]|nr:phosphoglucosamine mutase [Candidatus Dormibacteraeota bacterium]
MGRDLFGTDGVRGLVGQYPLDQAGAEQIGRAVGMYFAEAGQRILIASDPRESSAELVASLILGLTTVGVNVTTVGVIPTPGLAYLAREDGEFVAGVMVTASHNKYEYNGIKVFDGNGDKLTDAIETELNSLIKSTIEARSSGTATENSTLAQAYEDFLVSSAGGLKLDGLHLAVDSANGAASGLAERVFNRLGAQVTALFDKPDGKNINAGCGATDTKALAETVVSNKLAAGIALDGDADRVMLVDEQGRQLTGDHLLYILAVSNKLDGVVGTVMANLGLDLAFKGQGIKFDRAKVGDRYVLEDLEQTGFRLGGEQSGHIIFPELLKTGDGLLAAVQTLLAVANSGKSLAEWRDEIKMVPQALVNIPLEDNSQLERPEVKAFLQEQTEALGAAGRLLIRPSGTEPLARVMVEAPDAQKTAQQIAERLQELLGSKSS